ncbi:hypothetical protein OEZ85_009120 [Tetradesmus obliquus]|uniref:F-box domain-containing protein n=1 Tax=Tetradesmus obliquus TaxID=3088 RepID=A0ABY8TN29_TETOB|nr:hypothetical protein OEZ85_009120 [Tetradesmus obliquus]
METDRERPSGGASNLLLPELPGTFIQNLVCNFLDPGLRLSLRETCKALRAKVDAYSTPCCRLNGGRQGLERFHVLSQVSDGVQQLDASQVDPDLSCEAAEQQLPPGAWQKLRQLTCHCKQMVLVKTLVECSPRHLTSIVISARRGNWQHAGLLLQQLQRLPSLASLELALPPQHKLDELLAGLTQLRALTLTAAPRSSRDGNHWPLIPLLGASNNKAAKVDAAFWGGAICPLVQLTSLTLALPLCGTAALQLAPLARLASLHCCCAREQLPDLIEQLPVLQALTSLALDAKVGRRLSPAAMLQQSNVAPDLAPLGQLTRLVQLQLNIQQPLDLAALLPLSACRKLTHLGVSRLHLSLPWRGAELSPACAAAADAAEAALVAAVMAGQAAVPLAQVLLTKPGAAHAAPLNVEGVSGSCLPLLPALAELKVSGVVGRLPLAVLGPGLQELCIQGFKRVWSHHKGYGAADDQMDALMDVLAAGPAGVGGPPAAAAAAGGPPGAAAAVAGDLAGLGGAAGPAAQPPAAAAGAGRALLDSLVSLTVLMRGSGSVPGGLPHMPRLRRLCFYDDYDLRIPGRPLAASYDQKEDHQLWINQCDVQEITLAGSYILGGFFDGNALLKAKAQFRQLRRWVFRDCADLSAGHLAALLAVRVAPVVVLEGSSVLTHNDVRQLLALNPGCVTDVQWAAHVPPLPCREAAGRDFMAGVMGMDFLGPWEPAGLAGGPEEELQQQQQAEMAEMDEQQMNAAVQQLEDQVQGLFPPPWAAAAQQQQQQQQGGNAGVGGGVQAAPVPPPPAAAAAGGEGGAGAAAGGGQQPEVALWGEAADDNGDDEAHFDPMDAAADGDMVE